MRDNYFTIRPKERYLTIPVKAGGNDAEVKAPVHQIQYNLDTEERERYDLYPREWHRRNEEMASP